MLTKLLNSNIDGGNYTIRRSSDMNIYSLPDPGIEFGMEFINNDILNRYNGPDLSTPAVGASQNQPSLFPPGVSVTITNVAYDSSFSTIESGPDFEAGAFNAAQNILTPIPNWSLKLPDDTFNSVTNEVNNLRDVWEIQTTYDDSIDHNPLIWNGLPFKAGEVISDNFRLAIVELAAPGITNVEVKTVQDVNGNTVVTLEFDKTDATKDDVEFVVPKPVVDVADLDLKVTDTPIDVRVTEEPTVINIINETQEFNVSTPITDINFTGNDRTNVDLTLDPIEVAIRTEQVDVVFQNQGAQGVPGTGFVQIFLAIDIQPATPTGGSFNFNSNILTPPTGWSTNLPTIIPPNELWVSYSAITEGKELIWSNPFQITKTIDSGGGSGVGTMFRAGEPVNPKLGTIWLRRFTYSQNMRIGAEQDQTWLEIIPGTGNVNLDSNGDDTLRNNYLILDANTTESRTLIDFINSNNIGRKQ